MKLFKAIKQKTSVKNSNKKIKSICSKNGWHIFAIPESRQEEARAAHDRITRANKAIVVSNYGHDKKDGVFCKALHSYYTEGDKVFGKTHTLNTYWDHEEGATEEQKETKFRDYLADVIKICVGKPVEKKCYDSGWCEMNETLRWELNQEIPEVKFIFDSLKEFEGKDCYGIRWEESTKFCGFAKMSYCADIMPYGGQFYIVIHGKCCGNLKKRFKHLGSTVFSLGSLNSARQGEDTIFGPDPEEVLKSFFEGGEILRRAFVDAQVHHKFGKGKLLTKVPFEPVWRK